MVAIAADKGFKLSQGLLVGAGTTSLIEHERAYAVADVEQLRRRRVMARSVRIATHLHQFLDAECLQAIGDGGANASVILMITCAFNLHMLAIEQHAAIECEFDGTNSKGRFIGVRWR